MHSGIRTSSQSERPQQVERSHLWRGEEEERGLLYKLCGPCAVWRRVPSSRAYGITPPLCRPLEEEADDTEAVDVGVVHREVDPQRARRRAEPVVGAELRSSVRAAV